MFQSYASLPHRLPSTPPSFLSLPLPSSLPPGSKGLTAAQRRVVRTINIGGVRSEVIAQYKRKYGRFNLYGSGAFSMHVPFLCPRSRTPIH